MLINKALNISICNINESFMFKLILYQDSDHKLIFDISLNLDLLCVYFYVDKYTYIRNFSPINNQRLSSLEYLPNCAIIFCNNEILQ